MKNPLNINLLPAIVVAGPPHSGKSVLTYLLTTALTQQGILHYLLRAVPDGEGNWFLNNAAPEVWEMRLHHKTAYSDQFVQHMLTALQQRTLPLLVDVGGRPTPKQLQLFEACSHCILLYKTAQEKNEWENLLQRLNLLPIALLHSDLNGQDNVQEQNGVLHGSIAGLERDPAQRRSGAAFTALLERVSGIFAYAPNELSALHFAQARLPLLLEREIGQTLGLPGPEQRWQPADLARLPWSSLRNSTGWALYGRGPVWLAAALAGHIAPQPLDIFDVRFGWIRANQLGRRANAALRYQVQQQPEMLRVEATLPHSVFEPRQFYLPTLPPLEAQQGLLLSGKLPRWAFAALVRQLWPRGYAWIAIQDMTLNRAVVVCSRDPAHPVGQTI
mgnify:CR=1 FL=1